MDNYNRWGSESRSNGARGSYNNRNYYNNNYNNRNSSNDYTHRKYRYRSSEGFNYGSLPNTKNQPNQFHPLNFHCVLCKQLLIESSAVYRIHRNFVWATKVIPGAIARDEKPADLNKNKSLELNREIYSCMVHCTRCDQYLGYEFPDYEDPETGVEMHYKLRLKKEKGSEKNWMVWTPLDGYTEREVMDTLDKITMERTTDRPRTLEDAVREYLQDTFPEVNAVELTDEEVYDLIDTLDFKDVIRHHQQKKKKEGKEDEQKDEQQDRNDDDEDNNNTKKRDNEEEEPQRD